MNTLPTTRLIAVTALLFMCSGVSAQTTLSTTYTNAPPGQVLVSKPSYVTFTVNNANTYAVAITGIGNQHLAAAVLTGTNPPVNYSQNGCRYAVWYNETSNALAPINSANGWVFGDSSAIINVNTNGVIPVITNLKNVVIPPGATYRFAIVCSDSISAVGNTTTPAAPGSFNTAGVTLSTAGLPWGLFPNGSQSNGQSFNGNIVFQRGIHSPEIKAIPFKAKYCLGDDVTLTAKAESYVNNPTYTWKFNGNTVGTGPTYTITGINFATAGVYTCVVSDGTVSSFEGTYTLTVTDPPPPTVDGKINYCLNEQFVPVTINGQNPKWYYDPTGGSPIPVSPTINTSTPNSLIYYVSQTVDGCESSKRTLVKFTAAPKPAPPIVSTPVYYCEEAQSDPLTAVGNTLRWYYSATGGVPSAVAPVPNTSKLDEFEYFVTQTIDGCESERSKIDVVVTFKPNGQILVNKEEICQEDTVTITYFGSAYPGAAYNWVLPDGTSYNTGMEQGPLVMKLDKPGKQQISLRVGNKGCMSDIYTADIRVKALPEGTIAIQEDVCVDQQYLVSMPSYTSTTDSFIWNFDGGATTHYTTDQGMYGVVWSTAGIKNIQVRLVDEGCSATFDAQTIVHEKPDAQIIADGINEQDEVCASDSIKFSANTVDVSSTYKWLPEMFFDGNDNIPVTYARVHNTGSVTLTVTDEFGCINTDTFNVITKPCCEMTFPTAFTPNNDGRNDLFRPITQGNRPVRSFRVVNRYGQTVFETTDIRRGWDGTLNGTKADLGTYFYQVSFLCGNETVNQSGEVTLLR